MRTTSSIDQDARPPAPFRRLLSRRLVLSSFLLALVAAWAVPYALVADQREMSWQPALLSAADEAAADLVREHRCWSGRAPRDMVGRVPGHVVAVRRGAAVYGAGPLVDASLRQVFDGIDAGLRVIAFCR